MRWFLFILGSLATFRLSHLFTKEQGPFAVFERLRKAMPGGRGSAKEWLSCIFCFSLSASALADREKQKIQLSHSLAEPRPPGIALRRRSKTANGPCSFVNKWLSLKVASDPKMKRNQCICLRSNNENFNGGKHQQVIRTSK